MGTFRKTRRQHELCWENALAILAAAGMDHSHIVDAHVFITDRSHIGLYRETRDRYAEGPPGGGYASDRLGPCRPSALRGGCDCGSGPGHMSRSR